MTDSTFRNKTTLGRTGLGVSRIGLAGGYRFALTRPAVDACLAGPLTPEQLDRIHPIGDHVHG